MDADELRETVVADHADDLDLLGSSDLLIALSGGDPRPNALLRAAANSEYAARETFRAWADDATDTTLARTYDAVATQEDDHYRRVRTAIDGDTDPDPPEGAGPMHAYLRSRNEPIHRVAGGMIGRTLVSLRTHDRLIDFFADDPERAALFDDLREETADCLDDGLAILDARATADDWDDAAAVAGYTVRLAADDLRDAL
ncbi:rubrerythrin family protein [Haloplanus salilacus]|uniref:rubrerythrin family protein n=1 Tax=Haloplanus salilacus TaxID=2949994 RepID=UPI0030CCDAC8